MRALLLAGLVAWLAGAGGQQRHPYTLWADGDTQVGNNHHTLSGKPLLQLSYTKYSVKGFRLMYNGCFQQHHGGRALPRAPPLHPYTLWAEEDRQQMEPPANLRQYRDKSAQINVVHIMIIVYCPRPSL